MIQLGIFWFCIRKWIFRVNNAKFCTVFKRMFSVAKIIKYTSKSLKHNYLRQEKTKSKLKLNVQVIKTRSNSEARNKSHFAPNNKALLHMIIALKKHSFEMLNRSNQRWLSSLMNHNILESNVIQSHKLTQISWAGPTGKFEYISSDSGALYIGVVCRAN